MSASGVEVSVIVPCYNRSAALWTCLQSLAAQTHKSFEVIVIDDGSSEDHSNVRAQAIDLLGAEKLRWHTNSQNQGANASRNTGMDLARGSYLAFIDSDCIADPDWLDHTVEPFVDQQIVAVTGLVQDDQPQNIYERTLQGMHRLGRRGPAHRIVAGNMCVRASAIDRFRFEVDIHDGSNASGERDTSFSGRCDEESLHLHLRTQGVVQSEPSARVLHVHRNDARAFFLQAFHGGQAAAEFVIRHKLPPRIDVAPWLLAYVSIPFAIAGSIYVSPWSALLTLAFVCSGIAAIAWNELARKGRPLRQLPGIMPFMIAYYQCRTLGYALRTLRGVGGRN